jgi:glycosyltransferase involved in cell wall biosynthesis
MANRDSDDPVGAPAWRASAQRLQEQALPSGRVVVSCSAPFGAGGLGRHLEEIAAALARSGQETTCICQSTLDAERSRRSRRLYGRALDTALVPVTRFSPAWRLWKASVAFDTAAARRIPPCDHLIAFNGTALAQFRAARRENVQSLSLVSATAHMRRLAGQHALARRRYPLERSWATRVAKRNLLEYEQADRIYVSSRYVWESFVEAGISSDLLSLFPLTPHPRYSSDPSRAASSTFDIVYAGGLTVDKGAPLLIDAVRRLPHRDMRLILVGGWKTRGMRRFVEQAVASDSRISRRTGDPLTFLRACRLYVHPAYSDGFAYSAAEALACGVPVIVSEDTGMKDLIRPHQDGVVVPTGDLDALSEAIDSAYRGDILGA